MKRPSGRERTFRTSSEEETFNLARKTASKFRGDEVVLLTGELGAGKTVFAKGLAAGLGLEDATQVCSPSYTLVNIYQARVPVIHVDLYRLEGESEIQDIGWEDFLEKGVVVVEWADKLREDLPAVRVEIRVEKDNRRRITISSRRSSAPAFPAKKGLGQSRGGRPGGRSGKDG